LAHRWAYHRRRATIEILVGGGQRIKCEHVGDLSIMVRTFNPVCCTGFRFKLTSGPEGGLEGKARDGQGRSVFTVTANFKGLYSLKNVTIFKGTASVATAPSHVRGQRNFSLDMALEFRKRHIFSVWVSMTKTLRSIYCIPTMCIGCEMCKKRGVTRTLICLREHQ
jgi:hypothetical protein